jgi:hypothetical protein
VAAPRNVRPRRWFRSPITSIPGDGRGGGFDITFRLATGLSVLGVVLWALLVPKVAPVDWDAPAARGDLATQPA